MSEDQQIALVDLRVDGEELDATLAAARRVLERGWFVLGPEVEAFEAALATATGVGHAVGVGSGTDALILGMRAMGIGPGDEVVVPDFTAFPTAAAVVETGARPVLVDVCPGAPHLDLAATLEAIGPATRAVILVHLYGSVADVEGFAAALGRRGVALIEDCAQAQGATLPGGGSVGSVGAFGAFSFYPTKNLGAVGDGGAVVTNDADLASEVRAWRSHGERGTRYWHELPARNSRLDDLQAAILAVRLARQHEQLTIRRTLSAVYASRLEPAARYVDHGPRGAPHLAVVRISDRAAAVRRLREEGIGTGIHYPYALSQQPALSNRVRALLAPQAAKWAAECLSLPLHPRMSSRDAERAAAVVNNHLAG